MTEAEAFDSWAILELMGHRRLGGRVCEQSIAGAGFVRIDVPETESSAAFTQFYAPGSVYCVTPTTEEIARAIARREQHAPASRWELAAAVAQPAPIGYDDYDPSSAEESLYDGDDSPPFE